MNKIILVGRATRDPESSYSQSGTQKVRFTLAVDRPYKNQQGEKQADFIDCATWGKLAEICGNYVRKGLLVAVAGRLEIRPYEANDGTKRKAVEVVCDEVRFLERAKDEGRQAYADMTGQDPDNDLPF